MNRISEKSFRENAVKIKNKIQKRKRNSSGDEKLPEKIVKIDNDQTLDKCSSYVFKIFNIDVKIIKQEDDFHISNILFNRIGTGNDGNHIIPVSFFTSLITHFFTIEDKTNDCISKAQRLLVFFHKISNPAKEEYNAIATKLNEIINEDNNICCPDKLERFFCKTFMPYIIYIWDTRVSAKHFDSVDIKIASSEGSKVKTFNTKTQNLLKRLDHIDSKSFYSTLDQIRETLFKVIDIPIFVKENIDITKHIHNLNIVAPYLKEVLLFFVHRVIKIQKPNSLQKEQLIDNIKHLQNKKSNIDTQKISKLVDVLSQLQQKMSPEYSKIVDGLHNINIQDFCSKNIESFSYLVKEYLDIILYDLRKHCQLYLSIIEQKSYSYNNMYYLNTTEHKEFLKQFFNKKEFAKKFINKFRLIKNKNKLIKMFDNDNESELSFQYSDDQSLSSNNESQGTYSILAEKLKKLDNIVSYIPHTQQRLIEEVLDMDVSIFSCAISKLENSKIGRMSAIKWYCQQIQQKNNKISQAVKNILTKCTTNTLKENIRIQGKKLYEWYLDNESNNENRIAITQSILSRDDDTYITEFCQYILTKDESTIVSKERKKHAYYLLIIRHIDNMSDGINKPKYRSVINNILTKHNGDVIIDLLDIKIDGKEFFKWYVENTSINNDTKLQAITNIIEKCNDTTIIKLIEHIIFSQANYHIAELVNIQVHNQSAIKWYLGNHSVDHNDKVVAIKSIISMFENTIHMSMIEPNLKIMICTIKDILAVDFTDLKKELINIQVHKQSAIKWYLGNYSVSHNDKVTAIKTIIPVLNDNDILTIIKDVLAADNTDLKKELINIQVHHNQPAIKWYLSNHNVTHNDKITAIKTIIPVLNDNDILTIITDILTADSTDLKKELINIQVHNQQAIKWYLGNHNVTHNDKITAIKTIIPVLNDNDILTIIKDVLAADNTDLKKELINIQVHHNQPAIKWYLGNHSVSHNDKVIAIKSISAFDDNDILTIIKDILTGGSTDLKKELANIQVHDQPAIKWYLGNYSVSHNDKVIAIEAIIPALNNNNILAIIKDILAADSTDLKKELINIQIHDQPAIKWYLGNYSVSHNDKVTAIEAIIPALNNNNILAIIKDILAADSTDLKKELINIQIHDQQAIKWYLGNYSVSNNDKVTAIKTIIPVLNDNDILTIIKDVLAADNTDLKKELINIQVHHNQPAIKWYLGNHSVSHNDKVIAIKSISAFDDNDILTIIKDILTGGSTDLKKELINIQVHNQQAIKWYLGNHNVTHNDKITAIKTIIPVLNDNDILTIITDILTADSTDLKKELINIQVHNQQAIKWYLGNHNVTHNDKITAIKTIIPVLNDNDILTIITDILTADSTDLKKELINIQVHNQQAIKWYLGNHNVTHNDKITAIKTIIPVLNDNDILTIITDILTADSTDLKKELINIQVHNQQAIKWYLGNHNVTHNDKITAIKTIIPVLNDNDILTIITDILTADSTDLKKELINIQVHNQQAIKWYLGNHNVTHNDKVTAIKTIIPVLNDNDILTIITDILDEDNLNLIDALGREVTIHNQLAINWYLSSVNHSEMIQHIEKIISVYNQTSDATLFNVIDYIITECNQLLTKKLDAINTVNGLPILHWYIEYMIGLKYNNIIDTNDIAQSLYSILRECSENTIQSIEQLHMDDKLIFHWYMQHIENHGINLNNYENNVVEELIDNDIEISLFQILVKCSTDTIQSIEQLRMHDNNIFFWYVNYCVNFKCDIIQSLHQILIKCSTNTVQLIETAHVNNTPVFLYYVKYIRKYGVNDSTNDYVEDDLAQSLNYINNKCSQNMVQQISILHMNREPIFQWYNNYEHNDIRYNGFYEMDGLDQKSIHYNLQNIHGAKRMLNQSKVIAEYVHGYNKYLSILGIQDYKNNNHAVVFFKHGDSLSIIDPLDYISSCSNSFIKLKNQFLSLGIKTMNIIYSGLQQSDSGICADISLILIKNFANKLQDVQSADDVIKIITTVRTEMYGRTSAKNQETIIIKSFDAVISKVIDGLTRLNNYDVGIQDKQQQNNCSVNNEFVSTVQQDNFFIKPTELTGDIVSYTT